MPAGNRRLAVYPELMRMIIVIVEGEWLVMCSVRWVWRLVGSWRCRNRSPQRTNAYRLFAVDAERVTDRAGPDLFCTSLCGTGHP